MAVAVSGGVAAAQTTSATTAPDGPIILGQPQRPEGGLHLDPAQLSLDLIGVYSNASNTVNGLPNRAASTILSQQLNLSTQGYYLSPNFLQFSFEGSAGVQEQFNEVDNATVINNQVESTNGYSSDISPLYLWDARATVMRNGEWPLSLFSTRTENWIFRDFGPAIQATTTDTGASLSHSTAAFNTQIAADYIVASQSGPSEFDSLSYTQERFSWYSGAQLSLNQTLNWNYNYSHLSETDPADYEYTINDASISHNVAFGDNNRSYLTSTIRGSTQEGLSNDSTFENVRWTEQLYLWHSADLQTRYNLIYDWSDVFDTTRQSLLGTAGFTHRLYNSLTTNGNVGVQKTEETGGFETTEAYGDISWDYQKNVPYGVLNASLALGYSTTESNGQGETKILNQPGTFIDPLPIVLIGEIDPNTVILHDPSGLLYLPGIDYTVNQIAGGVEIQRILGGRIGNNQTVFIDYVENALPPSTIDTGTFSTGLRYYVDKGALEGFSLFIRYSAQRQNIDTENPTAFTLNEFDDVIYGAQYDMGHLSLGIEHQIHDSTIYPYNADRIFARYAVTQGDTTWSVNATFTHLDLLQDENKLDLYTISASATHQFNTRLTGTALILWRDEQNMLYGDTTGFEEQLELRWNYRQVQTYIQLRAAQLNSDVLESHNEFVQIGLRRYF